MYECMYVCMYVLGGICRSGEVAWIVAVKASQRVHEKRKRVRTSLSKRENACRRLQNRAQDRPSDPKSSSTAFVQAIKRRMSGRSIAIFFIVGASEPVRARKCALLGG